MSDIQDRDEQASPISMKREDGEENPKDEVDTALSAVNQSLEETHCDTHTIRATNGASNRGSWYAVSVRIPEEVEPAKTGETLVRKRSLLGAQRDLEGLAPPPMNQPAAPIAASDPCVDKPSESSTTATSNNSHSEQAHMSSPALMQRLQTAGLKKSAPKLPPRENQPPPLPPRDTPNSPRVSPRNHEGVSETRPPPTNNTSPERPRKNSRGVSPRESSPQQSKESQNTSITAPVPAPVPSDPPTPVPAPIPIAEPPAPVDLPVPAPPQADLPLPPPTDLPSLAELPPAGDSAASLPPPVLSDFLPPPPVLADLPPPPVLDGNFSNDIPPPIDLSTLPPPVDVSALPPPPPSDTSGEATTTEPPPPPPAEGESEVSQTANLLDNLPKSAGPRLSQPRRAGGGPKRPPTTRRPLAQRKVDAEERQKQEELEKQKRQEELARIEEEEAAKPAMASHSSPTLASELSGDASPQRDISSSDTVISQKPSPVPRIAGFGNAVPRFDPNAIKLRKTERPLSGAQTARPYTTNDATSELQRMVLRKVVDLKVENSPGNVPRASSAPFPINLKKTGSNLIGGGDESMRALAALDIPAGIALPPPPPLSLLEEQDKLNMQASLPPPPPPNISDTTTAPAGSAASQPFTPVTSDADARRAAFGANRSKSMDHITLKRASELTLSDTVADRKKREKEEKERKKREEKERKKKEKEEKELKKKQEKEAKKKAKEEEKERKALEKAQKKKSK